MKKIAFVIMAILMILPLIATRPVTAYSPRHGKGLDIYFYETPDQGWAALVDGEVDFFQWSLTFEQYTAATADPTIQLAGYAENGMMEFDLNNNYTVSLDYPGYRSPMNDVNFRRALAFATDKDWITMTVCSGFAVRIDAPVCAPQAGYANESVIGENYPYPYSMVSAADTLTAAGWEDIDDDGTLNYPEDWDGKPGRPNMDPVKVCIRSDHAHRLTAGRKLADNMRALKIPVNQIEASSDVLYPMVMDDWNYHVYTGGWSFGRYPTYLHGLYHSINCIPGGSDYITLFDKNGNPNYPDLDEACEGVLYAEDTAEFTAACKKATGLVVLDYCVNIPLWSYSSWWGYRKNIIGIVNQDGSGLENTYTFLNAYKVDDPATPDDESQDPIRMGTIHAPKDLNVLYSTWYYDYAVLDRIFSGLIAVEPYNLAADNPWIAQDWDEGTWFDFQEVDDPETPSDERIKTKVTYWIREDAYFHAPVTGETVRQVTAHDVAFYIWYIYAFDDCWIWGSFMDIHHTKVLDDRTIEVYFNLKSMWFKYFPTGPMLPKEEYLELLCTEECVDIPITETIDPENPDQKIIFTEDQVIQVINCTSVNEGTLIEGTDFEIIATGAPDYCHNEIHFLRPLTAGDVVRICYWTPETDPHGYYLGSDTDWVSTFYSTGPYYPIEIIKGVGGSAILNDVTSHFIGAPPLGEIDWKWTWQGTVKPRSGYFQVFLFDAVKLLGAYCSRGDGVPDLNWFPGADIDPTDLCHVGLYDAVTILGKYGQKFGSPP